MKLKSLLMGSAAALISVTYANAADVIVAEPEPEDHVKICDLYGPGFFYIPGTETCLGISGEMRIQYEYSDNEDTDDSVGDAYWHGRVNLDIREETDYGTLRTYLRLEGDGDNDAKAENFGPLDAYIELAGLSMGYRTSRVELAGLPGLMYDGSYFGGGRTFYGDYTYSANGFSVTSGISIENAEGPSTGDGE